MNKWSVDIALKCGRTMLHCCYIGNETNSNDVLAKIIPIEAPVRFICLLDVFEEHQFMIAVDDIVFMEIYPFRAESIKKRKER